MSGAAPAYDFPDFNRPATRLARVAVSTVPFHIFPNDEFASSIPNENLNDVMLITGQLLDGTGVRASSGDNVPPDDAFGRMLASFGPFQFFELPVQHRGAGLTIEAINTTSSTVDLEFTVYSFSGANVDTIITEAVVTQLGPFPVAGSATFDPLPLDQAGLYDRATITVQSDAAFTVTLRRRAFAFDGTWTAIDYDELLVTAAAAGSRTVDVPLGCPGAAVVIHNTAVTTAHVSLLARCYRPLGS